MTTSDGSAGSSAARAWAARLPQAVVALWAVALTVVLLWPLRRAGRPLGHDLVLTPRQPLDAAALGVSSAPPRAVPVDALVALAQRLPDWLGGGAVDRVALAVPLVTAGLGAAALVGRAGLPGRLAACGLAVWNPYVVERLALGQWSLLWGYAAIGWLLVVGCRVRRGEAGLRHFVVPIAFASITPTGGLLACLVVLATALVRVPPAGADGTARARRRRSAPVVLAVVMQAPWVVAALLSGAAGASDPASVAAFASRDETGLGGVGGVLLSLLGGGGVWNADVVPPGRDAAAVLLAVAVLVASAALARRRLPELLGPAAPALLGCAALGLALALWTRVPGLGGLAQAVVAGVPGGGLLRDAEKWVAPFVVLAAVLAGIAVDVVARALTRRAPAAQAWVRVAVVALVAVAAPLVLLPDATRAVWPTVTPVRYPGGFAVVDRLTAVGGGDVVVLPFQPYRRFAWAGERVSLDPAPRLLRATVITSDRLTVGDTLLAGDDPRAATVGAALDAGPGAAAALGDAGVGWVLVELHTPGEVPAPAGLTLVYADDDVRLYRVQAPVAVVRVATWRVVTAGAVLGGWLLLVAGALGTCVGRGIRVRARPLRPGP